MGDARGIGPEVIVRAYEDRFVRRLGRIITVGDGRTMERAARRLGSKMRVEAVTLSEAALPPGKRPGRAAIEVVDPGSEDIDTAPLRYIDTAVALIEKGRAISMATAPVNKEAISRGGVKFSGHTEYLAGLTGAKDIAMMFSGGAFRVAVVTRHIPLKSVSSRLTGEKIRKTALLACEFMKKRCGFKRPRIGVLALNPHAGDGGLIGRDEETTIAPAIKKLRRRIPSISGPVPADSAFGKMLRGEFDALVAMYHDQAMIPVKTLGRERCVNITLGLPFVRTSPVHGTAYDIAGRGMADPSGMKEAIKTAFCLAV